MMGQNVGMADRIVRIILAVVFIILALIYSPWWFIPAVIALVTGIVGWCGLYALFGWNTCPVEAKPAKKAPAKKPAVKAGTGRKLKNLETKIGKVPKFFRELTTKEPEMFAMVMRFEQHIWDDGKLSKKTKKLIAIAIAAALRDQHAVRAQLAGAKNLGVTKEEIEEALRVTFLLSGMPAYVYGKAQLDEVMK